MSAVSGVNTGAGIGTQRIDGSGNLTHTGDITFTSSQPTLTSGGSYTKVTNGIYAGSVLYSAGWTYARGGIRDDTHNALTVYGGSNGVTQFSGGHVGIGANAGTSWSLWVDGAVRFDNLNTVTPNFMLCLNSGGQVTTSSQANCGLAISSDQRIKENIAGIDGASALSAIAALKPVSFDFKKISQSDMQNGALILPQGEQLGFLAQEVSPYFPSLVTNTHVVTPLTPDGTLTLNYDGLIAPTIAALQTLNLRLDAIASSTATSTPDAQSFAAGFFSNIFDRIGQWLASASNGITDVFAGTFRASEEICVDDQCLTKDDVRALLALAHGATVPSTTASNPAPAPSTSDSSSDASSTTPASAPTIVVNGSNPATIDVGDAYADLGAIITGPTQADTNLGIYTFVDGIEMTSVAIDTSAPGTHTIDYVATNAAGSATSTRTVIVSAPAQAASSTDPIATEGDTATSTPDSTATSTDPIAGADVPAADSSASSTPAVE
jgi:hypothetical protein